MQGNKDKQNKQRRASGRNSIGIRLDWRSFQAAISRSASSSTWASVARRAAASFSCLPSSAKHQVTSVCLLTHARSAREFFHTFGDDRGQSHHLLAQVCVFRNVALNAIAIVL